MPLVIPRHTLDTFSKIEDPVELRNKIFGLLGDLNGLRILFNRVLVAIYIRPERTKGGIIRPGSNVEEDLWQSKVGVIVKMGQDAFRDDAHVSFYGQRCEIGDWIGFKIGDTWDLLVRDVPCRFIEDANVRCSLDDPRIVF